MPIIVSNVDLYLCLISCLIHFCNANIVIFNSNCSAQMEKTGFSKYLE